MVGELSLGGGGTEDYTALKYFSRNIKKMLYIPLAFPTTDYSKCLKWCKVHFKRFGITDITMLDDVNVNYDLKHFDAVYIGGGSTYKVLKFLKESGYDKKLIKYYKNGGRIGGGSAGAILLGKNIDVGIICEDRDENIVGLKDVNGLDLCFGWDIQVHYKDEHLELNKNYVVKNNRNIIAIPDDSSVVINGNEFKVIGDSPITLIYKDSEKKIPINEIFLLNQE
ncbi:MAG: Type 1 glutamine amidotransferase-like domain-containing protein [Candidatus Woesearchaeota archaeon]